MKELNLKIAILSFLTERNLQQFLISFYLFSISGILAQERSWFTPEKRSTRKRNSQARIQEHSKDSELETTKVRIQIQFFTLKWGLCI